MKHIIYISILLVNGACKEVPNYNPFDDQFNISVNRLVKDKCDTVSAGCGYFNLVNNQEKLNSYYQVYITEFDHVVAKGFNTTIDTFQLVNYLNKYDDAIRVDSVLNLPIDIESLNKDFRKYGYQIDHQNGKFLTIVNYMNMDTIHLKLEANDLPTEQGLVRSIGYFKSNKNARH